MGGVQTHNKEATKKRKKLPELESTRNVPPGQMALA